MIVWIFILLTPLWGMGFSWMRWSERRSIFWVQVVLNLWIVGVLVKNEPSLVQMFLLTTTLLWSLKNVGMFESGLIRSLTCEKRFLYYYFWIGMNPSVFHSFGILKPWNKNRFLEGIGAIIAGCSLLIGYSFLKKFHGHVLVWSYLLLLPGLSLIFHFGLLKIGLGIWEILGVSYSHFFKNPFGFRSLRDFWSNRWNFPYVEMLSLILVRPLHGKICEKKSHFLAFLFSGLLHEIAITVPIRSGYGGPTLYFMVQALLVRLEGKYNWNKSMGILYKPTMILMLIFFIPFLFPPRFVSEVLGKLIEHLLS